MRAALAFLRRNRGFLVFLLCMFAFRSAFADWNTVPTGSMQPTIRIGDRIAVNRAAYDVRLPFTHYSLLHLGDPRRGDIVIIDSGATGERLVKRVVGLPGDRVALRGNVLFVDGRAARYRPLSVGGIRDDAGDPADYAIESLDGMRHEVRLSRYAPSPARDYGPVTVPAGEYFVLGDNRDDSLDSRFIGFVPRREIVGRARYVVVSLDPGHDYLPRRHRYAARLDPAMTGR
jgi:signal peptidase I